MNLDLCLQGDLSNEHAEQSLPLCHWWMAFSWLSSKWNYCVNLNFCLLGGLNYKGAESYPVSPTKSLFNTIFWVNYHIDSKLCPQGDLKNWMCRVSPAVSLMNCPFKTIFQEKLYIDLKSSVSRKTQWWIYRVVFPTTTDKHPFQDHLLSKNSVASKSFVSQDTWIMNVHGFFPNVCHWQMAI